MTVEPQFVYGRPNPRYTGAGAVETPSEEAWEQRGEATWRANEWKPDADVDTGAHFLQGGLGLQAKAALAAEEQSKPVERLKDDRTGSPIYRIGESHARISRRGPHDKVISTMSVPEADQGKGNGTKILQAVTGDADRARDTLHLEAHAYQNRRLSSNQLRAWYARHGFRPNAERGGDWMIRHPVVRDPQHQATYAVNPDDKRLRQGQTPSNFVHPETGHNMGKSEIGDTFEQLFRAKGAHLLEEKFGGPYQEVTHVEGGPRNTPLDFRLDHLFGGELKTLNVNAKSQKTAIKAEEIARKYRAIAGTGMSPLMVVQVVDMAASEVNVYSFPDFASKRVTALDHLGSYSFTPDDFREAQRVSGHYDKREGRALAQAMQPTIAKEGHSELLRKRAEARKLYPQGHPERLKAERAVRQSRKEFREGAPPESPRLAKGGFEVGDRVINTKNGENGVVFRLSGAAGTPGQVVMFQDENSGRRLHAFARELVYDTGKPRNAIYTSPQHGWKLSFVSPLLPDMKRHITQLVTESANRQEGLLPGSTKGIQFTIDDPAKHFPGDQRTIHGDTHPVTREITLHPNVFTTPRFHAEALNDRGWWSGSDYPFQFHDQVIAHEIGHDVANRLGHDSFPTNANFWDGVAEGLNIPPPDLERAPGYEYENAKLLEVWFKHFAPVIKQAVSEYGTSSIHELLAELWSEYSMKEFPRAAARHYGDFIGGKK